MLFDQQYQKSQKASEHESGEHEEEESSIGGLSAGLMARSGGGAPLDPGVRTKMESSFQSDFSDVRVHTNSPQAASVGAQAFAHGSELHFAPGAYDPSSSHGQELIGHELAHVVQQRSGRVAPTMQGKGANLGGNASLEHEADVAGAKAARGEPAKVSPGTGSGVQFKGGPKPPSKQEQARTLLAAARDGKIELIARECVDTLKSRLAAKAELRFTNQDDGALFTALETAASEGVKESVDASTSGATDEQKEDVKAVSLKVAQRSKAAKTAISEKSKSLAATFSATHLGAFKTAAAKGYDKTKPSVLTISPQSVVEDAVSAARSAARGVAETEYQAAKLELDADLQKPANKTAYKTELSSASKEGSKARAGTALATRSAKNAEIEKIAKEAQAPHTAKLEADVLKDLVEGLGANGAHFWRPDEILKFRKEMKTAGRLQARTDIDNELGGATAGVGGATRRYVGAEAKMGAYDSAKVTVNKVLNDKAKELTGDVMTEWDVESEATAAARQSAFLVFEDQGKAAAAKTAAGTGAKEKLAAMKSDVMASSKAYRDALVKPPGGMSTERTDLKKEVTDQVKDDEVGKKSVEIALKANGPEDGLSKLGTFLDFIVPERGDAVKFKASLEIPAGPGNVLLELQGDAERGGRGRLHEIEKTGAGTSQGTNKRDIASLALGVELRIGYTGSLPGVKLSGAIGFFMRSEASDTDKCLKGLSYGVYRFLATKAPPLANLWGGSSSKAMKMSELEGGTKDTDLGDDVYRSELWAAMVEEQVFKKDHTSRVDIGGSANFGTEVNAGLFKGKAGLRGEVMQTFDHEALKRNVKKDKLAGGSTKIGDDSFDKDGAEERRKALVGRTVGAFQFETEFEFKAAQQTFVVGLKFKIETGGDWSVDLTGGIKVTTGDPSQAATRLAMGITGAAHSGIKTIIGVVRNIMDKDHPIAGSVGNVVDGLGRATLSVNDITNNVVGDAITKNTQVATGAHEHVAHGIGDPLAKLTHQDAPTDEATKGAVGSESMYRFGISMGSNKFLVKIDEVQSMKVQIGGPGMKMGGLEYEKTRRVAQIGATMDKNKQKGGKATPGWGFHGEGLGLSHS